MRVSWNVPPRENLKFVAAPSRSENRTSIARLIDADAVVRHHRKRESVGANDEFRGSEEDIDVGSLGWLAARAGGESGGSDRDAQKKSAPRCAK